MDKSSCCQAPLHIHNGFEGTSYYICTDCEEACDVAGTVSVCCSAEIDTDSCGNKFCSKCRKCPAEPKPICEHDKNICNGACQLPGEPKPICPHDKGDYWKFPDNSPEFLHPRRKTLYPNCPFCPTVEPFDEMGGSIPPRKVTKLICRPAVEAKPCDHYSGFFMYGRGLNILTRRSENADVAKDLAQSSYNSWMKFKFCPDCGIKLKEPV